MLKTSSFRPAWWLKNRHLQTVFRNGPWGKLRRVGFRREQIELPDGDFLHADWTTGAGLPLTQPLVVVLHGLEGSSRSAYAIAIMTAIRDAGWQGVLMHFRGCSGEPNRLPRTYHAGDTGDIGFFLDLLARRHPGLAIAAIGYSLGGNVLLKYLGENGANSALATAIAVSVPFDLRIAADSIATGMSRLYQHALLQRMRATLREKFTEENAPINLGRALASRTFHEFDEYSTAPLHGFSGCEEYYRICSSLQYLKDINTPTLLLHASDDPFMTPAALPDADELSDAVTLELSKQGGHVGFIGGDVPLRPEYWLEPRIVAHLQEYLPGKA